MNEGVDAWTGPGERGGRRYGLTGGGEGREEREREQTAGGE